MPGFFVGWICCFALVLRITGTVGCWIFCRVGVEPLDGSALRS